MTAFLVVCGLLLFVELWMLQHKKARNRRWRAEEQDQPDYFTSLREGGPLGAQKRWREEG